MFCGKCGMQFQKDDIICNNCGNGKISVPQKKPTINVTKNNTAEDEGNKALKPLGSALVGISLVILLYVGGPILNHVSSPPTQRGGLGLVDHVTTTMHQNRTQAMIDDASPMFLLSGVLFVAGFILRSS